MNDDLRIVKTEKALFAAMTRLLLQSNFKKISVLNLCEEAQVGRATFYAHFEDKYRFLKRWLETCDSNLIRAVVLCQAEDFLNDDSDRCRKMIANIILDADYETIMIMSDYLLSLFNLPAQPKPDTEEATEILVNTNFLASGLIGLLLWQINHFMMTDDAPFSKSLARIIEQFQKWNND